MFAVNGKAFQRLPCHSSNAARTWRLCDIKLQKRNKAYPHCRKGYNGIAKLPGIPGTWEAVRILSIKCLCIIAKEFLVNGLDNCLILERLGIVNVPSLGEHKLRTID
jgi:hypothetical protein